MKAPFNMRQRFMTVKEVANELKLSYLKTLDLINAEINPLPANKFGREYRIERGDLEQYLQATKVKANKGMLS